LSARCGLSRLQEQPLAPAADERAMRVRRGAFAVN
jgi:hypothetical protein